MPLKMHFLHSDLDYFPENLGADKMNNERGFIRMMETTKQGCWNHPCWVTTAVQTVCLKSDEHKRNVYIDVWLLMFYFYKGMFLHKYNNLTHFTCQY